MGPYLIKPAGAIWGIFKYSINIFAIMGQKRDFIANVQSKDKKTGRLIIELPVDVRSSFKPGDTLKVVVVKV